MMTYSAYISEDEPLAAAKLKLFLEKEGNISPITIFPDGASLLDALQINKPDILFLDIEMPQVNGIEVLRSINEHDRPQIIITSAYEKYALASFDFQVTDYLLKPYTIDRLHQALVRAKEAIEFKKILQTAKQTRVEQEKGQTITIRTDRKNEIVSIQEIIYLESLKDYTAISTTEKRMLTLNSITLFEQQLPSPPFVRIHRSYIINLSHLESYTRKEVVMDNGEQISIGPKYKDQFEHLVKLIHQK